MVGTEQPPRSAMTPIVKPSAAISASRIYFLNLKLLEVSQSAKSQTGGPMGKLKVMLGLAAACAACCAVPLALPLIVAASAGLGVAGIGAAFSTWWLAFAGLAVAGIGAAVLFHRRRSVDRCGVPRP